MKIVITATRPEAIEFETPELTGDQHVRNHIEYFSGSASASEKIRVMTLITQHVSQFWAGLKAAQAPINPAAASTPSPEPEEKA